MINAPLSSPLDTQNEKERIRKYGAFIQTLPPVNRATLAALIEHLYRSVCWQIESIFVLVAMVNYIDSCVEYLLICSAQNTVCLISVVIICVK